MKCTVRTMIVETFYHRHGIIIDDVAYLYKHNIITVVIACARTIIYQLFFTIIEHYIYIS